MKKLTYHILALLGIVAMTMPALTSCSDEPSSENYYTFTGEMMSEWLKSADRPEYSQFAKVVERAGLMDQLSAYGHYTCFAPNNEAMEKYLKRKGIASLDALTDADCDTLARTHLVNVMYTTFEMKDGVLATQNMNRRPIEISHALDNDSNSVVVLNNTARIYFELQDDSVENGVMHPISEVLESSNNLVADTIFKDENVSLYADAIQQTGIYKKLNKYRDDSYVGNKTFYDYVTGSNIHEAATDPDFRLFGFTAFLVPDSVLHTKYGIFSLEQLYNKACELYDPIYPNDVNKEGHKFENINDTINPLYRFIAYHLLNRNVQGKNYLTVRDDFGVQTTLMNPTDWYETMLPYTMVKIEHLTVTKWLADAERLDYYINRRIDDTNVNDLNAHVRGSRVASSQHSVLNGCYFYIDDIIAFDETTRDVVDNCRMRMDFSTIFPEVMTNDMRMNGDRTKDDDNSTSSYDHTFKYGRNFWFPNGYLENVKIGGNGYFIYRRPRQGYWSLHGDEFICQGNYDIEFRIPPVPAEGDYQIRLGYAAMPIRGIAQIYFDGVPQGIPLDMTRDLAHSSILGTSFKAYTTMTAEAKDEDRKTLKNKGFYRGANGGYRTDGSNPQRFSDIQQTLRIVLCTVHMKPGEDHYLRVRAVSSKQGNNNEVMLDYLELVPKSVYGINDGGMQEDDL